MKTLEKELREIKDQMEKWTHERNTPKELEITENLTQLQLKADTINTKSDICENFD